MIALGCDHGGYELMQEVKKHLEERGLEYKDFGCNGPESVDYPVYGKKVAEAIVNGECENGILICGTGIGISITANKFKGIRIGSREQEETIAHHLYEVLRDFDSCNVSAIYSEAFFTPKMGQAIMNRLLKAAGHKIINVEEETK